MNLSTLFIALPIFFFLYQGIGLVLERRRPSRQSSWHVAERSSFSRSFQVWIERTGQLGFNKTLLKNKKLKNKLDQLLVYSGNPWGWKADTLLVIKEALTILGLLAVWYSGQTNIVLWALCIYVTYKLPDLYLISKAKTRRAEIQKLLPSYVDLLTLTMEGGMDLLAATEKIIEKMRSNPLKDELNSMIQENRLGTSRRDAFLHLSTRVNLSDMSSMTSMIMQSEEMGTKLSTVLRSYSEDMRSKRILRAEEVAGQAPVKMLFPMMVFFFPIVFVIIFGPLALNFFASGGLK